MDYKLKQEYTDKYEANFVNSKFGTKVIHCGQEPDIVYGCMAVPLCLASTYKQSEPNKPYGPFDYSRCGNPTKENLERQLSGIEGGKYSLALASGCAITTAVAQLAKVGEHIVCIDDVYGGTQRIFRKVLAPKSGIEFTFTKTCNVEEFKKSLQKNTRIVWVESPTNPTLKVTDMKALIAAVREYNKDIIIVCDNTFLSPYNYRPLEHGADIVVESATKYLGGHSDVVMGILSTNRKELYEEVDFISKTTGAAASPFDCYMLIRGIKTLHLRMERANFNGLEVAKYLEKHPKIEKVNYAGLESSPYYEIAKKNGYKGNSGMVSFYLKSNFEGASTFLTNCKVFSLAESLGAVESLIEHPETMTHASVPKEYREELGITPNFIRMSVGCEDIEDLIADLEQALALVK